MLTEEQWNSVDAEVRSAFGESFYFILKTFSYDL